MSEPENRDPRLEDLRRLAQAGMNVLGTDAQIAALATQQSRQQGVIYRFGLVLYWTANGIALLFTFAAVAAFIIVDRIEDKAVFVGLFMGGAVLSYLFGRACRFIFSGF